MATGGSEVVIVSAREGKMLFFGVEDLKEHGVIFLTGSYGLSGRRFPRQPHCIHHAKSGVILPRVKGTAERQPGYLDPQRSDSNGSRPTT